MANDYYQTIKDSFFTSSLELKKEDSLPIAEVDSVESFLKKVKAENKDTIKGSLYRGQRNSDWLITSSLTRHLIPNKDAFGQLAETQINDRLGKAYHAYLNFKHALPPFYREITSREHLLPSNDLSLLMLAQHYGLPTRLIDWSLNPLVALYFAVEKSELDSNEKAAVYIYSPKPEHQDVHYSADEFSQGIKGIIKEQVESLKIDTCFQETVKVITESAENIKAGQAIDKNLQKMIKIIKEQVDKFKLKKLDVSAFQLNAKLVTYELRMLSCENLAKEIVEDIYLTPYLFDRRMQAQHCMFTFTKDILKPFPAKKVKKIIIKKPYQIKTELITLNFATTNIYPSISGLCESIVFEKFNPTQK